MMAGPATVVKSQNLHFQRNWETPFPKNLSETNMPLLLVAYCQTFVDH